MPERVKNQKALTNGDSPGTRGWVKLASVRHFLVRQGHKSRRRWEQRELRREEAR